ncbi:MAG: hypothetical protein JWR15_2537 [Prosthecobacter sp.]|nr:hypothetical protein [Prosthecobacter sp.]
MMSHFGRREDFAIEVGSTIEHGDCQLDFYAYGIHLNRVDNAAYVGTALHCWPTALFSSDRWAAADTYSKMPFSSCSKMLLKKVMADNDLFHEHLAFNLGPVTDSFSTLTFGRPTDFVLLFIRNDRFGNDDSDLPKWNRAEHLETTPTHWLSLTIQRKEFEHICSGAYSCLEALCHSPSSK